MSRRPALRHHRVYRWPADPGSPPSTPSVRLLRLGVSNVDRVLEFRGPRELEACRTRLSDGRAGVLAELDGRVVGHAWAALPCDEPQVVNGYFRLRPGQALIEFCHVAEAARGKGVYPAMIRHLATKLAPDHEVFIDCAVDNLASVRGIERAGFRAVYEAWYATALGRVLIARRRPVAPAPS